MSLTWLLSISCLQTQSIKYSNSPSSSSSPLRFFDRISGTERIAMFNVYWYWIVWWRLSFGRDCVFDCRFTAVRHWRTYDAPSNWRLAFRHVLSVKVTASSSNQNFICVVTAVPEQWHSRFTAVPSATWSLTLRVQLILWSASNQNLTNFITAEAPLEVEYADRLITRDNAFDLEVNSFSITFSNK